MNSKVRDLGSSSETDPLDNDLIRQVSTMPYRICLKLGNWMVISPLIKWHDASSNPFGIHHRTLISYVAGVQGSGRFEE